MHEVVITLIPPDSMTAPEFYSKLEDLLSEFHVTDIYIREMMEDEHDGN